MFNFFLFKVKLDVIQFIGMNNCVKVRKNFFFISLNVMEIIMGNVYLKCLCQE